MAQRHIVFTINRPPVGSVYFAEGLRATVGATAGTDEHTVDVLYLGDGVYFTLKGVDRGKWEVDVVAEADAPLDAVDAVVRGVQRRAGEGAEPDRLSTEAFREALDLPLAQLERA